MTEAVLQALKQGQTAAAAGDVDAAQRWLERALRLAPRDATTILSLAGLRLSQGDGNAADLFADVAKTHDLREAWLGLAVARHLQAKAEQAAEALGHALSRHARDVGSDTFHIADAIAHAADVPGWCGMDGAGALMIRLARVPSRTTRPAVMMDGRPIRLRTQPGGRMFAAHLPEGWERAGVVTITLDDVALLGSPISIRAIIQVEGFAESTDGDLHGWAWCPHDPHRDPMLSVTSASGSEITILASDRDTNVVHQRPLAQPRSFRIPATRLQQFEKLVSVCGRDGRDLTGSPLDPSAERRSAEAVSLLVARLFPASTNVPGTRLPVIALPSVPANVVGHVPLGGMKMRSVDVVVPVYNGLNFTLACLDSVLADLPRWARILVVDDASPDPRVAYELKRLAARKRITMLSQTVNRGFTGAANIGMRHDPRRDVVLLNSDTLVPPNWLPRLRDVAYSMSDIGSVTPLSNDATIVSYPSVEHSNPVPQLDETIRLDGMAQVANAGRLVDIPSAVGFCMYIKRDCLNATGLFREDQFAQGYGEENDFCIRARHLGWRHVAAPGVFVAHVGGQSFGATKHYLVERNLRVLNRLHPGYDALIRDFQATDPLSEPRRRLDMERWKTYRTRANSVLLVTHGRAGGVQRRMAERASALRAAGLRPIVLWPVGRRGGTGRDCVLGNGPDGGTPNLRFALPSELHHLARFLKGDRPVRAEVHHLIGHDHALLDLFRLLNIPYEVIIHDYSWICPRVNLVGPKKRYCGEPDVVHCDSCVADAGTTNDEDTSPRALRERSRSELAGATRVIAPSQDVATRMQRHFPQIHPEIVAWEDDAELRSPEPSPVALDGIHRVCVVGGIGVEKGFDVLLACARDAAERKLKLEFCLVGHSLDDARLLATSQVHITGRYEEHEAVSLIRAQRAQLAWLTSLWPETWCYTLTQAWRAGLNVAAFDIGAPAERIRHTGRGWLFPLGMPAPAINNRLLHLARTVAPAATRLLASRSG